MAETAVIEAPQKKRSVFADPSRILPAEFKRHDFVLDVPPGITIEDCLEPDFWAITADKLEPYDHVEVRQEDGSWIAELLVMRCERTWAKVHLLNKYDLGDTKVPEEIEHKHSVEWKGPHLKWAVIRRSDGAILKDRCEKSEAIAWLRDYDRTVG